MTKAVAFVLGFTLASCAIACSGSRGSSGGGSATVTIADTAGTTFNVTHVKLTMSPGADAYFRIEGDDAAHPEEDCLPGLSGGIALYGDLPAAVGSLAELSDREVPFEFTGDGDDFNLCFVGSQGLFGVESGAVRFGTVAGTTVPFSFTGSFVIYDGVGGHSPTQVTASGTGSAQVVQVD